MFYPNPFDKLVIYILEILAMGDMAIPVAEP